MKFKGLGRICYLLSDLGENNRFVINLINRQVKSVPQISVIVKEENLITAQSRFSKRVSLYNASFKKTSSGADALKAILKVIKPTVVFVSDKDSDICELAHFARIKILRISESDCCKSEKNVLFLDEDISTASVFATSFLEKKFALDFYPKHYLQRKATLSQMKFHELVDAVFNRTKRIETDFKKEWGYSLPANYQTYNEALNRFKTFSYYKKYRKFADKLKVRRYMNKIGYSYLLPQKLAFVRFRISKRLWNKLPDSFIIKPTNASGLNVVIENKSNYNLAVINRVLNYIKRVHYGLLKNEPVYAFNNDFLITEYIPDLTDYKFFCFNGEIKFVAVVNELKKQGENGEPCQMITDENFNELPFSYGYERGSEIYEKPVYFDEMAKIAKKLSSSFKHVRLDMMGDSENFYFGEFTFFSGSGRDRFTPSEYDKFYGDILKNPL